MGPVSRTLAPQRQADARDGALFRMWTIGVILAGMAAYVRDKITGEVVSACCLDERDAVAAAGCSEFLDIDTWMASKAQFPRRSGLRRDVVRDLSWPSIVAMRLQQLERVFHAACR